jgi:ATP-dependent Clp protease ATP-binding subunit ClpB
VPAERARLDELKSLKARLEAAKHELEVAQRQGEYERASRLRYAAIPELEAELARADPPEGLHERVTADDVARVIARATGVPVHALMKGERDRLVHVSGLLSGLEGLR